MKFRIEDFPIEDGLREKILSEISASKIIGELEMIIFSFKEEKELLICDLNKK
jgi:hypothetical protein